MIHKNIVCTDGPKRYGKLLNPTQVGDIVFLSGKGILNYGEVMHPYTGVKNYPPVTDNNYLDEHSIDIDWHQKDFDRLKVVSASAIRKLGYGLFVPTIVSLASSVAEKIIGKLK